MGSSNEDNEIPKRFSMGVVASNLMSKIIISDQDSIIFVFVNDSSSKTFEKISSSEFILDKKLVKESGHKEGLACFEKYNFVNIFNGLGEGFDTLTRIFYSSIHDVNLDKLVFKTMINRKKILVDRELISKITKIPLGSFCLPIPKGEKPSCETISYGLSQYF